MNCMSTLAGPAFDPVGLKRKVDAALELPLELKTTEPFEELLKEVSGQPLAATDEGFAVWVAMAVGMESTFWETEDALPKLKLAHESILQVLSGVEVADRASHALEVTLVWLHGATRKDFDWNSLGWNGCAGNARSLIRKNICDTVQIVISWLGDSQGPVGPRVPGGLREVNVPGLVKTIQDYLVGWSGGACPCCRAAAAKLGWAWHNLDLDNDLMAARDNESRRICTCLRHHRLSSFLGQSPLVATDDFLDIQALADLLKTRGRAFDKWLFDQLEEESRSQVEACESRSNPKHLIESLAEDINHLLQDSLIYDRNDEARFAGINLPTKLLDDERDATDGAELRWLNRRFLELALVIPRPKKKNLIASCEWLSLGQFLQQAVRGMYGSVKATALTSGMLYPLLQRDYALDYVNVAVRICEQCEARRKEESNALPEREQRGRIYSYTLKQCCACKRTFSDGDKITLARFHIITTPPPDGYFRAIPSWICPECDNVYPARRCLEEQTNHDEGKTDHDECLVCERKGRNVRHCTGRRWNRGKVFWWDA
jgi:hypothetical protein